jgi:hypothetical protein
MNGYDCFRVVVTALWILPGKLHSLNPNLLNLARADYPQCSLKVCSGVRSQGSTAMALCERFSPHGPTGKRFTSESDPLQFPLWWALISVYVGFSLFSLRLQASGAEHIDFSPPNLKVPQHGLHRPLLQGEVLGEFSWASGAYDAGILGAGFRLRARHPGAAFPSTNELSGTAPSRPILGLQHESRTLIMR